MIRLRELPSLVDATTSHRVDNDEPIVDGAATQAVLLPLSSFWATPHIRVKHHVDGLLHPDDGAPSLDHSSDLWRDDPDLVNVVGEPLTAP